MSRIALRAEPSPYDPTHMTNAPTLTDSRRFLAQLEGRAMPAWDRSWNHRSGAVGSRRGAGPRHGPECATIHLCKGDAIDSSSLAACDPPDHAPSGIRPDGAATLWLSAETPPAHPLPDPSAVEAKPMAIWGSLPCPPRFFTSYAERSQWGSGQAADLWVRQIAAAERSQWRFG